MKLRPGVLIPLFLTGLLVALTLTGLVAIRRARALASATTIDYKAEAASAEWKGSWEFSDQGADPSEAGCGRVNITFTGTDLALRVRRGNYRGYFFVTIDGEPANRLPQDERGAYVVLTSPDLSAQVVSIPVAAVLEEGPHTVEIVAERGWDQWPLVGWSVTRKPNTAVYDWALVALGALSLACISGAILSLVAVRSRPGGGEASVPRFAAPPALLPALTGSPKAATWFLLAMLASAGLFYFAPVLPVTMVAGLALAALILLRLDVGLALVAAFAPFYLKPRPIVGKAFSMVEIAVLLCAVSWGVRQLALLARRLRQQREGGARATGSHRDGLPTSAFWLRPPSPLDLAVLAFVLVATASLFVAEYRHVALRELRVLILEPALFYLMLRTTRIEDRSMWRIVDLFVIGATAVATIGLAQYALGVNIITAEEGFRRLRSVYGSPNSVGLYLGRALPMVCAIGLLGKSRRRRIAYGLAILPVAAAIVLSFSKGAILIGVPASLLAVGLLAGGRWAVATVLAGVAAALGAVPLLRTPRFSSLFDVRRGTTFFRLQLWRSAWAMFCDHPWLGVGPDNFLYSFRGRYIRPDAWQEPHISQAHNILLDYATRMGVAGVAAGAWLQVTFWRAALPLRHLTDRDHRALALGLMGAMVNFLAHGLVDASHFLVDLAFALLLTLGLVQWLVGKKENERES